MKILNVCASFVFPFVFLNTAFLNSATAAEIIQLPPEELAQESVLPKFDRREATKNRTIMTGSRMEAHLFYGLAMTEPVASTTRYGLGVYYNFNEDHALGVLFAKNSSGLSSYSNQLDQQFNLDLKRAPYPESTMLLDYNYKAYYGKMSLTKKSVSNFILFFTGAGGMIKYVHKSYPTLALGLGQKFYLTRSLSVRLDFRLFGNNSPKPFKAGSIRKSDPVPEYSEFSDQFDTSSVGELGISYLF